MLSYHSLEDRMVKRALVAGATSTAPPDLPVVPPEHEPVLRLLTRGAETADRRGGRREPAGRLGPAAGRRAPPGRGMSTVAADRHGDRDAGPAGRRPPAGRGPAGPRLRLVPPLRTGAPRAPFVVLVGTLLIGGARQACCSCTPPWRRTPSGCTTCKVRSAVLTDREQALEQEVALEASPRRLAARAEALGMVRSENPAFIRLSDGRVLGKPKAGVAPPPPAGPDADRVQRVELGDRARPDRRPARPPASAPVTAR